MAQVMQPESINQDGSLQGILTMHGLRPVTPGSLKSGQRLALGDYNLDIVGTSN